MNPATTVLGKKLEDACKYSGDVTPATPITLMGNFMGALADYISTSITVIGTFAGTTISTPPVAFTCPVSKGSFNTELLKNFPPPMCAGADEASWMIWLTQIYAGIKTVTLTGTAASTATPPLPLFSPITPTWTRNDLKSAFENDESVWDKFANNIISDMKKVNITTYPSIISGTATGADTVTYEYL